MTQRSILVVPCFNEAARLDISAFRRFINLQDRFDILFVNDGSTDQTIELLNGLEAEFPQRFTTQDLTKNLGKAEAVRTGINAALRRNPPLVGFWDADLATPLIQSLHFADFLTSHPGVRWAFGSRVKMLGRQIDRRAHRHYLGRVFATAVSITLDLGIYDSQCGAKLFRADDITCAAFRDPFLSRWIFDVELLARLIQLHRSGAALPPEEEVAELPLEKWHDVQGSKLSPTDFLIAAMELRWIWKRYIRA